MSDAVASFLEASIRTAVPLGLAALGELLVERAGLINIGLEGTILAGAFGALVGASAVGGVGAGFAVAATAGLLIAALFALALGFAPVAALLVPVLFAGMGIAMGIASPSRDLLVKRSSPENATGRVYGVVYSGLDIGQALAPLAFGRLMDMHRPQDVWLGIAIVQALMIVSAFNIQRVRRTPLSTAAA